MGGGEVLPSSGEIGVPSTDEDEQMARKLQAKEDVVPCEVGGAQQSTEVGGIKQSFSNIIGTIFDFDTPFPDFISVEEQTAATEGARLARIDLPKRAEEWRIEEERAMRCGETPNLAIKFIYGWTLLMSRKPTERHLGVKILAALVEVDAYHPDECSYALAKSSYLIGDLTMARQWCETLLRMKPDSARAQELHSAIRTAQSRKQEKALEVAVVGGAVIIGAVSVALALASGGKSRR